MVQKFIIHILVLQSHVRKSLPARKDQKKGVEKVAALVNERTCIRTDRDAASSRQPASTK
jgi:hypothetical protein